MRPFDCACGARVFFENSACVSCGGELGFLPDVGHMGTFEVSSGEEPLKPTPVGGRHAYRRCFGLGAGIHAKLAFIHEVITTAATSVGTHGTARAKSNTARRASSGTSVTHRPIR